MKKTKVNLVPLQLYNLGRKAAAVWNTAATTAARWVMLNRRVMLYQLALPLPHTGPWKEQRGNKRAQNHSVLDQL